MWYFYCMASTPKAITVKKLSSPTLAFTKAAQQIGYAAWKERFTQRTEAEIRMMFNPNGPDHQANAHKLLQRMQAKAEVGKFSGVLALDGLKTIGYSWAADDAPASPQQASPDTVKAAKPYVWIAHINVLPAYQGKGIGSLLLQNMLQEFDADQVPTAYVFEENQPTLRWMESLGFIRNPDTPRIKYDYFGDDKAPVEQWRLTGQSVQETLSALSV
jgi:ribosomal protein S18 acetylase RimI-like enzyme